jgi:hypothetical protein
MNKINIFFLKKNYCKFYNLFVVAEMSNLNICTSNCSVIFVQTELFVDFISQTCGSANLSSQTSSFEEFNVANRVKTIKL